MMNSETKEERKWGKNVQTTKGRKEVRKEGINDGKKEQIIKIEGRKEGM